MTNSLPLTAISLLVGLFFIFVGLVKVTPQISEEIHRDWKNEFGRYNKVFPFAKLTKWRPYARNWRLTIGITEIICGVILVLIPGRLKTLANIVLLSLMSGALYTHVVLKDSSERLAPSIIFILLLSCRLIISYQSKKANETEKRIRHMVEKEYEEERSKYSKKNYSQSNLTEIQRDVEEKKIK